MTGESWGKSADRAGSAARAGRGRGARSPGAGRAFTLLELLVVIAIVTVLMSLTLGGIQHAIQRAEVARARGHIEAIKLALSSYEADLRSLPRPQQGRTAATLLRDGGPYLYAALMNRPTPSLGGGPNAPYVQGRAEISVGILLDRAALEPFPMGADGAIRTRELSAEERARLSLPELQREHGPESAQPLVFLDPWGNPWHVRVWKGVRGDDRDALIRTPVQRSGMDAAETSGGATPVPGPVADLPHDPYGVDIWSDGPNGVNEFGAGDDVASWHAR